jgi:hypothetical protein
VREPHELIEAIVTTIIVKPRADVYLVGVIQNPIATVTGHRFVEHTYFFHTYTFLSNLYRNHYVLAIALD